MNVKRPRASRWGGLVATVIGLGMVLSGCGTVYDLPLPGGADVGSNPLKIHVLFADVADLVPQSTVKVNDVSVGKVTAIDLKTVTTDCPGDAKSCQVADVSVEIPRATKLPANAVATIRQTSLLGEKFVSLAPPAHPDAAFLEDGATIGLADASTNPEVEQVLKAMGALFSGGGVGQLKVISEELNKAIGGKESQVRAVLNKLHYFMGQLDDSKAEIVTAIDNLNRLAVGLKKQNPTIIATLDQVPAALASVNKQRGDLVKMLSALNKLSDVGVQVIMQSKTATINSLTDLAPVLSQLAKAGDNLPKSFQVILTYPFIDGVVGSTPAAARKFEMGDYTNLSINLDLDLLKTGIPGIPGINLQGVVQLCKTTPLADACDGLNPVVDLLCGSLLKNTPLCASTGASSSSSKKNKTTAKAGGTLNRSAYGAPEAPQRSTGGGMPYLLLEGASQ